MRSKGEKEFLKWAYFENTGLYWMSLKLAESYWSYLRSIFQFLNHKDAYSSKCTGFYNKVPRFGQNREHCNDYQSIPIHNCTLVHQRMTEHNPRGCISDMSGHHMTVPSSVVDRDTVPIGIGHVYNSDCMVWCKLLSWLFLGTSIDDLPRDRNQTDSSLLGNLYQQKRFHLRPSLYR